MSFYTDLDSIVARLETELLQQYPNEAGWLIMMTPIRQLWMGGYDVLGNVYESLETAAEAQRAMIMQQLSMLGATHET